MQHILCQHEISVSNHHRKRPGCADLFSLWLPYCTLALRATSKSLKCFIGSEDFWRRTLSVAETRVPISSTYVVASSIDMPAFSTRRLRARSCCRSILSSAACTSQFVSWGPSRTTSCFIYRSPSFLSTTPAVDSENTLQEQTHYDKIPPLVHPECRSTWGRVPYIRSGALMPRRWRPFLSVAPTALARASLKGAFASSRFTICSCA